MADVWDPGAVSAMADGRARTARPVSRTSMGLRRVGKVARPVHHALGTGDAYRMVDAPACRLGRA